MEGNYQGAIILADMGIAEKLGLKSHAIKIIDSMIEVYHVKVYDLYSKGWVESVVERKNA